MKLEIGGGVRPRGDGWVNLDQLPTADVVFDLDTIPPGRLPFADEEVAGVYSSHCFEHLRNPHSVWREVARVCRTGAEFEMRVPHPLSDLAMTPGHLSVIAPVTVINTCHHFVAEFWPRDVCPRRLELVRDEYSPSCYFEELKGLYSSWTPEQVLRFAPRACHDVRFFFRVVANV